MRLARYRRVDGARDTARVAVDEGTEIVDLLAALEASVEAAKAGRKDDGTGVRPAKKRAARRSKAKARAKQSSSKTPAKSGSSKSAPAKRKSA